MFTIHSNQQDHPFKQLGFWETFGNWGNTPTLSNQSRPCLAIACQMPPRGTWCDKLWNYSNERCFANIEKNIPKQRRFCTSTWITNILKSWNFPRCLQPLGSPHDWVEAWKNSTSTLSLFYAPSWEFWKGDVSKSALLHHFVMVQEIQIWMWQNGKASDLIWRIKSWGLSVLAARHGTKLPIWLSKAISAIDLQWKGKVARLHQTKP